MKKVSKTDELLPYEVINQSGSAPLLVACDHAANYIPDFLNGLGLEADILERHIAYDIGARQVAMLLAELFDAPLLLATYSRLLIDLNRHLHDPSLIVEKSDGVVIPGNQNLSDSMRTHRIENYFNPYHATYQDMVSELISRHERPIILSIHSFTPRLFDDPNRVERPWHIGVLWDQAENLAQQLIENLSKNEGYIIGDNKPYHATDPHGYAQVIHAHERGVEFALLETRQDLISDSKGQSTISRLIHEAVVPILK